MYILFCYKGHIDKGHNIYQSIKSIMYYFYKNLWMFLLSHWNKKDSTVSGSNLDLTLTSVYILGSNLELLGGKFEIHPEGKIKTDIL